eukprot:1161060-Pelagomonas_calceolata.AAC.19
MHTKESHGRSRGFINRQANDAPQGHSQCKAHNATGKRTTPYSATGKQMTPHNATGKQTAPHNATSTLSLRRQTTSRKAANNDKQSRLSSAAATAPSQPGDAITVVDQRWSEFGWSSLPWALLQCCQQSPTSLDRLTPVIKLLLPLPGERHHNKAGVLSAATP